MSEKKEEKQIGRYSKAEKDLMKNTFSNGEELLKAIRKVFLQLPISAFEQTLLSSLKHEEVLKILRKTFLPTLDGDAPFNQVIDLWMTLDIKDRPANEGKNFVIARAKLIQYLDQQLKVLEGKDTGNIVLTECVELGEKSADEIFSDILFRNTLIYHVEQQLTQLQFLAEQKEETLEEAKARMKKDSLK